VRGQGKLLTTSIRPPARADKLAAYEPAEDRGGMPAPLGIPTMVF
jgi:hypothetical protein